MSNDNNISILWTQSGLRKKYYYFKQYGFNGINLYNILNINNVNTATAALSTNGAAGITMAGVIALSWSGSLFLSTLENSIPNNMVKTKTNVSGAKFVLALPVRCVEWTSEEQVFWTHREDFFLVMKNFLDNILGFDEFETAFSLLFRKTTEEVDTSIIDLKQIEKFQPSTRSYRFASFIAAIFREFEEVEDEYCTEQEVKDYVKQAYFKFQKFEE